MGTSSAVVYDGNLYSFFQQSAKGTFSGFAVSCICFVRAYDLECVLQRAHQCFKQHDQQFFDYQKNLLSQVGDSGFIGLRGRF